MTPENPLTELIEKFNPLKDKYDLPDFSKLNELFDIEDVDPESEFLLRKIRRVMAEKIASYLRFSEIVLNPSNAPMFFFKILKKLNGEDRDSLSKIYETLGKTEVKMLALDIDYDEAKEAEFIKETYRIFSEEIKEEFLRVVEKLNNGKDSSEKVNGSYFG